MDTSSDPGLRVPRTSVLINNYNHAPFLRHCLDSVLGQSLRPHEVVVVDDGSTDESLEILRSYGDAIRLIALAHGTGTPIENQARAILEGFRASTGEILFLLDGDDAFLPGKIATYVRAFMEAPDAVMVQAPLEKIDETGRTLGLEFETARHQQDYLAHIYAEHELNIYYPTSALAFTRAYLDRHLPVDLSDRRPIWPDARLALIAPHFGRVIALSRPYTQWRRHSRSHTVARPLSVYQLVRLNQAYFNAFCRRNRKPTITPWKSHYHRLRWLKHHLIPARLFHWYRIVRWATLNEEKRRRLLAGPDSAEIDRELARVARQMLPPSPFEGSDPARTHR